MSEPTSPLDVTDWSPAEDEPLGTKPKMWLYGPPVEGDDSPRWLWKQATTNRDKRRGEFLKGDDWSEVVASRLGATLGLPVAKVMLAERAGRPGIVSRSFLRRGETLVHGDELLAEVSEDGSVHGRQLFTLDNVVRSLDRCGSPGEHDVLATAVDWFTGFLLLDALLGNTDRHEQNWGAIEVADGSRRLAPSFDHASCLGFMLHDDDRVEYLDGSNPGRSVSSYAARAKAKMLAFASPTEAAVAITARVEPPVRGWWIDAIDRHALLDPFMVDLPATRLTPEAAGFAAALYRQNHEALSQALRTMQA